MQCYDSRTAGFDTDDVAAATCKRMRYRNFPRALRHAPASLDNMQVR